MDTKMKNHLVISVFNQAYGKDYPNSSLVVHTNQGRQFTSKNFRMLLKSKKDVYSQSRKDNPYDRIFL